MCYTFIQTYDKSDKKSSILANIMTDIETARWNTESAALLALSEIHGVSYWTLYKVAQRESDLETLLPAKH